jgi:hypothetical protein
MKKSIKAALLSAFVFPGVGHIYLKRHIAQFKHHSGLPVIGDVRCIGGIHEKMRMGNR